MMKMLQAARLIQQGLIFAGSIAAGCVIGVSPSQALSFSGSGGFLSLTDFEPGSSEGSNSFADTVAFSLAGRDSTATTLADAFATISQLPTLETEQRSLAFAAGQGTNYFATASGFSTTQAFLSPSNRLSFNFTAVLGLISGRNRPNELGQASGTVGFQIFDGRNSLLDAFSLTGLVSSQGANLFSFNSSSNLQLDTPIVFQGGDNLTNEGLAIVRGSYSREFDSSQYDLSSRFSIQGETLNNAIVAVPSPSLLPGALVSLSAIFKRRRKARAIANETLTALNPANTTETVTAKTKEPTAW